MHPEKVLNQFLERYCSERLPLLLGLSGGPDSIALFHLLVQAGYPFECAHIDHGWRKESGEERLYLGRLCQEKGIVFHSKELVPPTLKKNLEALGREARLSFFREIQNRRSLNGVLLAHHADDMAETVLKRLFEGATLPKLRGLLPKLELEGITLYRPLLKIKKSELLGWLEARKIPYFLDPTNEDPHFLRSRLRGTLMPTLAHQFGKEITSNLCKLGESAAELDEFLEECSAPYLSRIETSPGEFAIDFTQGCPQSSFLWKIVLRNFFARHKLSPSLSLLEAIQQHLYKGSCHKLLKLGTLTLSIHRRRLSIIYET